MGDHGLSPEEIGRINILVGQRLQGFEVVAAGMDVDGHPDPTRVRIELEIDQKGSRAGPDDGGLPVTIDIERRAKSQFVVVDGSTGCYNCGPQHPFWAYVPKLNAPFREKVAAALATKIEALLKPKPRIVSQRAVPVYSYSNPTQRIDPFNPTDVFGWLVMGKEVRYGRRYLVVRDPAKRPASRGRGIGYRPVHVVLVGARKRGGPICKAYERVADEIARHKGADFRLWWLKSDGSLVSLKGNPDGRRFRIRPDSSCWWQEVLTNVKTEEGDTRPVSTAAIFVRDPSDDPFAKASCGWPEEKIVFEQENFEARTLIGIQATGQQTIDARHLDVKNTDVTSRKEGELELRRIAQGVSQRYFEAMQERLKDSDFLVLADDVTVRSP